METLGFFPGGDDQAAGRPGSVWSNGATATNRPADRRMLRLC
jgi:hypothetical protein